MLSLAVVYGLVSSISIAAIFTVSDNDLQQTSVTTIISKNTKTTHLCWISEIKYFKEHPLESDEGIFLNDNSNAALLFTTFHFFFLIFDQELFFPVKKFSDLT